MKASQMEESLAKKYKQPKGVEQFGIEAVSDELRTVRWWDTFLIVLNFIVNPGTIVISGSLIAAGMSFWEAILTGFFSIVIGFSVYLVAATVGVDYGIPGLVSLRRVFGIRGSWIASGLRAVSSVYWFAFQTIAGSIGLSAVLEALMHRPVNLAVISVVFALFQVAVATVGYNSLKILSRYTFVLKIVFSIILMVVLMNYPQASFHPSAVFSFATGEGAKWGLIALWSTGMAAAWFSNFTDAADFCRYSKTRVDMWIGTFLAAVIGQIICSFVGGYAVAAVLGKSSNAFDVIVQTANGAVWLLILIFVYIVMDNWTINVQNLYTGGLAISNIFTSLGRFWGTIIVSGFGVFLSLLPQLVNGYIGYMSVLGDLFAPMGAVFVAHYLIFSRGRINVPALYDRSGQYWYWNGFNWIAFFWMVVGYFINKSIPQSMLNIVCTTVIVGFLYWLSVAIIRKKSAALLHAIEHQPKSHQESGGIGSSTNVHLT
ncbi:Putative allantoin permease [Paenibacillus konkukensis]|uniref:Allantoin permease n=1 Tax=Paenibacillus konkukensis TaxID=2020716 RepID=A0ABY4RGR5_9BACL|nr:cytosine permease [Paenibacillus konkukensis]UQZ81408.1 Putative allantoin permease [Paenibacillus konkukensis]